MDGERFGEGRRDCERGPVSVTAETVGWLRYESSYVPHRGFVPSVEPCAWCGQHRRTCAGLAQHRTTLSAGRRPFKSRESRDAANPPVRSGRVNLHTGLIQDCVAARARRIASTCSAPLQPGPSCQYRPPMCHSAAVTRGSGSERAARGGRDAVSSAIIRVAVNAHDGYRVFRKSFWRSGRSA